ncbi:MAG: 23S rRNA (adenine(2503)-C(2))-methyltransferase RlmN [Bacteroidales bacterium]|nr:23S rRNA (adenine(2503)-C(2))-methyltransferase RlmN [Bacteroidales bacterium]MCF6342756.1 23S rRNA (adenine(2503)-C(2))-methyltransferase RlmN [Bacteroidales bacterium]
MKENLFGKTLSQIRKLTDELSLPGFTAKQIADWLYKKDITSIGEMSNLSKKARVLLDEKYNFGLQKFNNVQESADGTKKYLFEVKPGQFIESAFIPETKRRTLCLSSQVGCKRRCLFCMTGKQGLQGQLTAGEILNQVRSIPEFQSLTNLVYMGMGEPLDNLDEVMLSLQILTADWGFAWSPRRITVSTIGIVPAMKIFAEHSDCHLAVSLHTPFDVERKLLMPVNQEYPLADVVAAIKQFDFENQRRISFEYIVFKGMNDTLRHVNGLARLLNGIKCRINLIRFHPIPETPLEGTDEARLMEFKEALIAKGITTTIRASRGQDIDAACGLLSTKEMLK